MISVTKPFLWELTYTNIYIDSINKFIWSTLSSIELLRLFCVLLSEWFFCKMLVLKFPLLPLFMVPLIKGRLTKRKGLKKCLRNSSRFKTLVVRKKWSSFIDKKCANKYPRDWDSTWSYIRSIIWWTICLIVRFIGNQFCLPRSCLTIKYITHIAV